MDDPLPMRRLECLGDLTGDGDCFLDRHPPGRRLRRRSGDELLERLALDELHGDRANRVSVLSRTLLEAVDLCDVRMIQRGEDLGLTFEAGEPFGVICEGLGQHLDGDASIEPGIAGPIDLAHAAGTKWSDPFH